MLDDPEIRAKRLNGQLWYEIDDIQVAFDPNGAAAAIVFKTISDQYGKYSMIKVVRGKVTGDVALYNPCLLYTSL